MKRFLLLASVMLSVAASAVAQEYNDYCVFRPDRKVRMNTFNFCYVSDKIKFDNFSIGDVPGETGDIINGRTVGLENNWGASLTYVQTHMLHRRPIGRVLGFGLDVSFFDATYANYTIDDMEKWGMVDPDDFDATNDPTRFLDVPMHKMEYSLQIGPSITLTPGQHFTFTAYARYAPTFAGICIEKKFYGNYASMFNLGGSVAWRNVGFGIEARMGGCHYKDFTGGSDLLPARLKTSGFRAFMQIRW